MAAAFANNHRWWRREALHWQGRYLLYKAFATDVADQSHLLRSMTELADVMELPAHRWMDAMSNAMWRAVVSAPGVSRHLLSSASIQACTIVAEPEAGFQAELGTARVAVALERHRLAHDGALPETLEALAVFFPEGVPLDPFTGEPLRYERQGRGYRLHSVGKNGVDNGGDPKLDIVFQVVRP